MTYALVIYSLASFNISVVEINSRTNLNFSPINRGMYY